VPYTAGDTWRDSLWLEPCRRTCALPQAHRRRKAVPAENNTHAHEHQDNSTDQGVNEAEVCRDSVTVMKTEDDIKQTIMTTGPVVAYIDAYR
jgi:hypothetical protein